MEQAENLFREVPETPAISLYRSYARLSRARLDSRLSNHARALAAVAEMESLARSLKNPSIEVALWQTKADVLTRAGRLEESEEPLRMLLELGSALSQTAPAETDLSMVRRRISEAVNVLATRYLDRGNANEAWRVWTRYNSCFETLDEGDRGEWRPLR